MALLHQIKKVFKTSHEKEWFSTYWAFDIHGTIFKPTYNLNDSKMEFYPFAKKTLQLLSSRRDIQMIIWSSSYPHELKKYDEIFVQNDIYFNNINENPSISSNNGNFGFYDDKFYFNVLFEDKCGFLPEIEWEEIYNYLLECEITNYLPNSEWTTKF